MSVRHGLKKAATNSGTVSLRAAEESRIIKRRIEKAERDERMDITRSLTEVKTFAGGFTNPTWLRVSNWFPGGPYVTQGKKYLNPVHAAYTPHTVFILESRHRIKFQVGRTEAKEFVTGICRASDMPAVLRLYNSPGSPERQLMDNARWFEERRANGTQWWKDRQDFFDIRRQVMDLTEAELVEEYNRAWDNVRTNLLEDRYEPRIVYPDVDPADLSSTERYERPAEEDFEEEEEEEVAEEEEEGMETVSDPSGFRLLSQTVEKLNETRSRYYPLLPTHPFWRPLITVTLPTRPLALSVARLARGLPRGAPFYTSITPPDRKCMLSFSSRMRCIRINRLTDLTIELSQLFAGARGGLIGIRYSPNDAGRGIDGELLDRPLDPQMRRTEVAVGNWFKLGKDVSNLISQRHDEEVLKRYYPKGANTSLFMYSLDEFGTRFDKSTGEQVPYPEPEQISPGELPFSTIRTINRLLKQPADTQYDLRIFVPSEGITVENQPRFASDYTEPVPDGFVSVEGPSARAILRAWIEVLMERYQYDWALFATVRSNKVTYPP